MSYITHEKHDENAEGDHHKKKKKKKTILNKKSEFKRYHKQSDKNSNETIDPYNIFANQGNRSSVYNEFAKKMELNIVPYFFSITAKLYYGDKPLTKHSIAQTGY